MFGKSHVFVVLVVAAALVREGDASAEIMKSVATGFMKVLDQCKHKLNLNDHILNELYHYWKGDFSNLSRDTGCVIVCMSEMLELIDSEGKLHHGNAQEFAMKHGAGEDMASKLVEQIHKCEKEYASVEDNCSRALEVAKCFRTALHEMSWAPMMNVMVTEVLTDI